MTQHPIAHKTPAQPVTFTGSLAVPEEAAGAGTAERQINRFGLVHEALKRGPGIT